MDFENIILNNKQIKLLKASKRNNIIYNHDCDTLIKYGLVEYSEYTFDEIGNHIPSGNRLSISTMGESYLLYMRKQFNAVFYPILISAIGVIAAIVGIILNG